MKFLKQFGIVLFILYILLTFKIQILQNHDVYIRIIPSEKIEYLFISGKMKKALKEFERNEGSCKKLNFSNKRILFSKDKTIYEIVLENNKAETKKYIPEYSYTVEDTFNLKLIGQDSDYFQMVCFSIIENENELYSSYFTVCPVHEIVFREYTEKKIYELLSTHKDAQFKILECRE